jgi:GNAT superfamily N-acetyltransferase
VNAQLQPRLVIGREPLTEALLAESAGLLYQHWEEIATFREWIPLDPNWPWYLREEAAGRILCLTARVKGTLIGYSVFALRFPPHYQSTFCAINDVIWVHPEHRLGRVGLQLIRESESQLRALGVKKITWHAKPATALHQLLERIGYSTDEVSMARLL